MDTNILIAFTFLFIGIEKFAPIPGWVVGILAIVVGILLLLA